MARILIRRTTRSALNTNASGSNLLQGELYLITDEDKIAVAKSTTTYEVYSKDSHNHTITSLDGFATGTTFLRRDGTWVTPTNTTYSEISQAEIDAGTATTTRTITGRRAGYMLGKCATAEHNHNLNNLAEKSYNSLSDKPDLSNLHAHSNKATLDGTQESFTTVLKSSYDGAVTDKHTHTNKTILDGIINSGDGNSFLSNDGTYKAAGGGSSTASFHTQSNTTIDCDDGDFFIITVSSNSTFSFTNIETGKVYNFCVKNSGASTISISLPSGEVFTSASANITAGKARDFTMIYDGSKQRWQISEELLNA